MKDLILFGMQGSGKGTQGSIVAKKHTYEVFDTGSALRAIAKEETELGATVQSIMNEGKLVSTEIVMQVLEAYVQKFPEDTKFIFDGIPRSEEQKEQFEIIMDKLNRKPVALYINVSREEGERRLLLRKMCKSCNAIFGGNYSEATCNNCGGEVYTRKDDNPEAIKQRLDIFFEETMPILDYYKSQDRFIDINGEASIDAVTQEIEEKAF